MKKGVVVRLDELLKRLMLGLIYPAVLGTILYSALDVMLAPLVSMFTTDISGPPISRVKAALLGVTLVFYCFDYVYIMFTNRLRPLFFLLDVAFLVTLYVTFWAIGARANVPTEPRIQLVLWCYVVFLGLYLIWDVIEKVGSETNSAERRFYTWVITWETVSLVAVALCLYFSPSNRTVVLALAGSTLWFGFLAWRKRRYYRETV